jgi:hypothetical protein
MSFTYVTPDEVACDAGISVRTVHRDLSGGRLPSLLIQGRRVIPARDADHYVAQRRAILDAHAALGAAAPGP